MRLHGWSWIIWLNTWAIHWLNYWWRAATVGAVKMLFYCMVFMKKRQLQQFTSMYLLREIHMKSWNLTGNLTWNLEILLEIQNLAWNLEIFPEIRCEILRFLNLVHFFWGCEPLASNAESVKGSGIEPVSPCTVQCAPDSSDSQSMQLPHGLYKYVQSQNFDLIHADSSGGSRTWKDLIHALFSWECDPFISTPDMSELARVI